MPNTNDLPPLPPIIRDWIAQLQTPDVIALVEVYGEHRRLDVTLFSDRGHAPKPPTLKVV